MMRILIIVCFFFLSLPGISLKAATSDLQDVITRVAILKDATQAAISVRGQYEIIDSVNGERLMAGRRYPASRLVPVDEGLFIGKKYFPRQELTIVPKKDVTVYVPDGTPKRYRGELKIVTDGETVTLINYVELEDYVQGVLFHEVKHRWPMAVLKAQAVATRTYALYQIQERKGRPWDVTSDIYSQVYGGRSAERHRTNLAVRRTAGKIMMHGLDIVPAYFHANSGGHTENAGELWNHSDDLLPGRDDPYSEDQPGFDWKKNFHSREVKDRLNDDGIMIGDIEHIEVIERSPSGRVRRLKIMDRQGGSVIVTGKTFRQTLGPNFVRSLKFDVDMQGYYFDLIGHGWGHGVGMSQWGAYSMATQRYNFEEILAFYYPNAELIELDTQ
jgi:stage II sporulation protein D